MNKQKFKLTTIGVIIIGLFLSCLFSACEKDEEDKTPDENGNNGNGLQELIVTDIDGNEYRTIIIGNKQWMSENLRVERFNNEEDIPYFNSGEEWDYQSDFQTPAYTVAPYDLFESYNSENEIKENIGFHYNWYAIEDERNICPQGWRIPTNEDWEQLALSFNPEANLTDGVQISLNDLEESEYTFNCEGGFIDSWGTFLHIYASEYWTLSEDPDNVDIAYQIMIIEDEDGFVIYGGAQLKSFGMTIRCVKDI